MIVTAEMTQRHVRAHCPDPLDVTEMGQVPGSQVMCGCGRCPTPDPSPAEMLAEAEAAAWRRASNVEAA